MNTRENTEKGIKPLIAREWQESMGAAQNFDYMFFFGGNILMTFVESLKPVLTQALRFGGAALAMIASPMIAIMAIREAHLARNAHTVTKAVIESMAAAAFILAGIGVIAAVAALAFVAPILITAALGLRFLFSVGSAISFGIKISKVKNDQTLEDNYALSHLRRQRNTAIADAIFGGIITGVSLTLLLVAAPVVQLAVTITGAVAALAAAIVSIVKAVRADKAAKKLVENESPINFVEMQTIVGAPAHEVVRAAQTGVSFFKAATIQDSPWDDDETHRSQTTYTAAPSI